MRELIINLSLVVKTFLLQDRTPLTVSARRYSCTRLFITPLNEKITVRISSSRVNFSYLKLGNPAELQRDFFFATLQTVFLFLVSF